MKRLLPRLGLAGGIDRDGRRAAELLAAGFGSVEFGTVTPEPGRHPGVALLVQRLAALGPRRPATPNRALIGVGLGLGQRAAPAALGAHWLAGLQAAAPVADYLSFNLSAAAYRPLLGVEHAALLAAALATVADARAQLAGGGRRRRRVALALKLPLDGPSLSAAAQMAVAAGFDALIAVLPQRPERFDWLHAWAQRIDGAAQLVAVGGIRSSADVRAALDAGAGGIQVHRVFAEQGSACLPPLLAGLAPADRGRVNGGS